MARRSLFIASCLLLVACASTQQGPFPPDASPKFDANVAADAAVQSTIDAASVPDAPIVPDAAAGTPDSSSSMPDSASSTPDAPGAPDAPSGPDACVPNPLGELCNGIDDNCNGTKDEGFPNVGKPCVSGLGECEVLGQQICDPNGTGLMCDAIPKRAGAIDLCDNNKDDDCDGKIDEDFPTLGKLCMAGVGACQTFGVNVCNADLDGVECDAVPSTPKQELCGNGIDDDCDGEIDEGFTELGQECSVGLGECKAKGVRVCNPADRTKVICGAIAGDPEAETCDGKDNDCDGVNDNNDPGGGLDCNTPMPGVCGPGKTHCVEGKMACVSNSVPDFEKCNGMDDDCDGLIDDRFHIGEPCDSDNDFDMCKNGVFACLNEDEAYCVGDTPKVEVCNGLDDDCDGDVDEGFDLINNPNSCGSCTTVCSSNGVAQRRCTGGSCDPTCAFGRQSCDNNLTNGCEANRDTDPPFPTTNIPERVSGDVNLANVVKSGYAEARYRIYVEELDDGPDNQWVGLKLTNPDGVNMDICASCNNTTVCSESSGRTDTIYLFADETPFWQDDSFTAYIDVIYSSADRTACGNWQLLIDSEADNAPDGSIVIDCD